MQRKYNLTIAILVGVLTIVLIGGAYTFIGTGTPLDYGRTTKSNPVKTQSTTLDQQFVEVPLASDNEKKESNPQEHFTYNVHYPSIAMVGHPELAKAANAVIETFVIDAIDDFVESVRESASPNIPTEFTSDLTIRYNVTLLSPTILSVRFEEAEYLAGAAHPNSQIKVFNYDLERKMVLATSELFASTTTALPFLSKYVRDTHTHDSTESSDEEYQTMFMPGSEPTAENFKNVALSKEGIVIVFNPYQIAPYARGSQEVRIPMHALSTLLAPRVLEAIRLASTNIIEATPEETPPK